MADQKNSKLVMPERKGITVPDRMTAYNNPKGSTGEKVVSQTTTLARLVFAMPGCSEMTFEAAVYAEWPVKFEGGKLVPMKEETGIRVSLPKGVKWVGNATTIQDWLDAQLDAYLEWAKSGNAGGKMPKARTGRTIDLSEK